jgi:small subunit ribosomal protein S21
MLVINIKENESIDRALKQYKNKFRNSGQMKQLRSRKHFTKPSIERREEVLKATYIEEKYGDQ